MKENGLNKLINLLNEYDDGMVSWYEEYFSTEGLFVTNAGQGFSEEFILGKRYGFIKRLVDNDKIDLDKRPTRNKYRLQQYKTELGGYGKIDEYSELLMLLSIQENPITFLISILR